MQASFKIKSRSLPHFRQRLYQKIDSKFINQPWRIFLFRQLQLTLAIRELSRAEFDISNQNHHKFAVRQNFQIKKEIIKCLEEEDIESALMKLSALSCKMKQFGQEKGVNIMIIFLQCRSMVKEELSIGREEQIIKSIKLKLADHLYDTEGFFVKMKTMTMLSILLLRFHGILMTVEERNTVLKTIEIKKKKMAQVDNKDDRLGEFECLLYLILELYKILFLLKLDQQMILRFYNQLHAYAQIFIEKKPLNPSLDIQELLKILADMKPVINDLNIYEDSKLRKQLVFEHIKSEVVEKEERKVSRQSINLKLTSTSFRKSFKAQMEASSKLAIRNKLKLQDSQRRRTVLKRDTGMKLTLVEGFQNQSEIINELAEKGIFFDFILPIKQKFFVVGFKITFRNGWGLIDLNLQIKTQFAMLQKFRMVGIKNILQKMNIQNLAKLIERISLKIFGSAGQFREIHNLVAEESVVPLHYEGTLFALMRAKAVIKEFMRRTYQEEYIISKKFIYPKLSVAELNAYLQAQSKEEENRRIRSTFEKRQAFLHVDQKPPQLDLTLFLKFIVRKEMERHCEYFFFNAYYAECFKGLDVHCLRKGDEPPDLTVFTKTMKEISKVAYQKHQLIQPVKAISEILELQNKYEVYFGKPIFYRLQQELQLNSSNMPSKTYKMKIFNPTKPRKLKKKPEHSDVTLEVIRIRRHDYVIFSKQVKGDYVRLSNQKTILNIPLSVMGHELVIEKKRVRMYNTVQILEEGVNNIKTTIKNGALVAARQEIVLLFSRSFVLKKKKGYILTVEYLCPLGEMLYEFVVSPIDRYYCLLNKKIQKVQYSMLDFNNLAFLNTNPMHLYKGQRQEISQANYFYISQHKK